MVVEAAAEAVVARLVVEVGNGNAVVGEAKECNYVIAVAFLEDSICDSQFLLSVQRCIGQDEAVQVLVTTIECGDKLLLNHSVNGVSFCKLPVLHIT